MLGLLASWLVVVQKIKGRAALDALSLMPAALPGIVVGVGLILLWNQRFWPVSPYNTWVILLLSYCCLLLPWPVRYVGSALRQLVVIWSLLRGYTGRRRFRRYVLS
jgi:iron(III) transport system permease protein